MTKLFLTVLMLSWSPWLWAASLLSNPTLANFNKGHFLVTPNASPATNVILLNIPLATPGSPNLTNDLVQYLNGAQAWHILTNKGDLLSYDGTNSVRLPVGTNGQVLTVDSSTATGLAWANASGGSVEYWTNNGSFTQLIDLSQPVRIGNSLTFGPGETNRLRRDGSSFAFDVNNSPILSVSDSGTLTEFSIPPAGANIGFVFTDSSFRQLNFWGNLLYSTAQTQLGIENNPWGDIYLGPAHNAYISGFSLGGGDLSRLAIYHTGTNGDVVFDSQSIGAGGDPRDFAFQTNSVTVATISANGAFSNGGNTNQWVFKAVTIGGTTNITVNIDGADYTFRAN